MAKVYVISDLHLGHESMAVKRSFKSAKEQDSYIKEKWNEVVGKRDKVYILGDITMEKSRNYYFLDELKGLKEVILGNHDMSRDVNTLLNYVDKVAGAKKYKGNILTHIPIHESEIERFRFNIHGHVHENSLKDFRYINVSCEVLNYTPKLFSELISEALKKRDNDNRN